MEYNEIVPILNEEVTIKVRLRHIDNSFSHEFGIEADIGVNVILSYEKSLYNIKEQKIIDDYFEKEKVYEKVEKWFFKK